jgi:hypothetical protein
MTPGVHTQNQITKAEIRRLTSLPKLEGYFSKTDLESRLNSGATPQHIVGEVTEIRNPVASRLFSGDLVEWVPIYIRVESAHPKLESKIVMLRLFPSTDLENRIEFIKTGDRVLAMTSLQSTDDNKYSGFSLGSLFRLGDDGNVYNFDGKHQIAGSSAETLSRLNLN